MMLKRCEKYALDHKLVFSTDPDARKSKTKCLYMTGPLGNVVFPMKVKLDDKELSFVESASHLGHELHQMTHDCKVKKAQFMDTSTDIRETFSFANPDQVLSAINLYAGHFYDSMLCDFLNDLCGQLLLCETISIMGCSKINSHIPS